MRVAPPRRGRPPAALVHPPPHRGRGRRAPRSPTRLSFGLVEPAEQDEAVRRLALALREVRHRGRASATDALS